MTGPVTTEALIEKLARSMWEQSYATLQDASWDVALQVAKHIPDGQAASCLATVRSKAAEIVAEHFAPLLAGHQQVTAERDAKADVLAEMKLCAEASAVEREGLLAELARLRAEGEAKDRALKEARALYDRATADLLAIGRRSFYRETQGKPEDRAPGMRMWFDGYNAAAGSRASRALDALEALSIFWPLSEETEAGRLAARAATAREGEADA